MDIVQFNGDGAISVGPDKTAIVLNLWATNWAIIDRSPFPNPESIPLASHLISAKKSISATFPRMVSKFTSVAMAWK
jgi:DNA-binding helix-hairpin-helix protein with protein kinase domain